MFIIVSFTCIYNFYNFLKKVKIQAWPLCHYNMHTIFNCIVSSFLLKLVAQWIRDYGFDIIYTPSPTIASQQILSRLLRCFRKEVMCVKLLTSYMFRRTTSTNNSPLIICQLNPGWPEIREKNVMEWYLLYFQFIIYFYSCGVEDLKYSKLSLYLFT